MKKKIKLNFLELILIVAIPCIIMSLISGILVYKSLHTTGKVSSTNNKYVNEFIRTYNTLLDNYYEKLDQSKLVDAAISGMMSYTGDDYTMYMDTDATDNLNDQLGGTYEGIGVRISIDENNKIYIYEVFENSPASKVGILVNDIVVSINDTSLEGKTTLEAANIIKNCKTNTIKIVINRNGEELSFDLKREKLIVPAIKSSIKEINGKKIGYMYLEAFSSTLDTQVESNLIELEKGGIESLIIDVRGNTGGYLNVASNIIQMFLSKDKLMYTVKSKTTETKYKDKTDAHREYPIVVIMNEGSASASEILASSLKYSYGAKLIGTKSYGKGKVQETRNLEDGTMIKYTSAKWYTPNGDCIDGVGLKPDVEVTIDENYILNQTEENDNQLNEAIKMLSE